MSNTSIKIGAGFGTVNPVFHLKKITLGEESEFYAKLASLANPDDVDAKREHHLTCSIEAIKNWSVANLTKAVDKGDQPFYEYDGDGDRRDPSAEVDAYFEEAATRGDDVHRLASTIVNSYLERLQPTVNFF